jgi:hypothetical protein
MRLARRVSLIVVLFFIVPTGTALADCAWVLWVHETRTNRVENRTAETWETASASSTESGCDAKLNVAVTRIQQNLDDGKAKAALDETMYYKVNAGQTVTLYFYRKGGSENDLPLRTQSLHHVCLPDSIDPRAPKAK